MNARRLQNSAPVTRQSGVALITAVLIVALATILATKIGFDSALEQRRSAGVLLVDQAFQVALGAEAWASSYLIEDAKDNGNEDHLAERWATPIPPIPIDGGHIEGQVEDLTGRFNLNNLVMPTSQGGVRNPEGMRVFQNLLTLLELEPKWAEVLADYIDEDNNPTPSGGEDSIYLSQAPPYRTPNAPITSVSELLALPEFGLERYQRLRPYVAALPVGTAINLCTASGIVLDAISEEQQFSIDPQGLAKQREQGCHPKVQVFTSTLSAPIQQATQQYNTLTEKTSYFQLRAFVTIGTAEYSLYSLLYREPGQAQIRPLMRNFGAD